jgi:hypothetical protein
MSEYSNITLQELNVDLQIEKLKLGFSQKQHSILEDDSPTLEIGTGKEETYNLFSKIIKKVRRIRFDQKDPRLIMI